MSHRATQMIIAIGQVVQVRVEAWIIPMKVTDAKSAWGNIRIEVEPLNGTGRAWIELSRLVIPSDSTHLVNCHA